MPDSDTESGILSRLENGMALAMKMAKMRNQDEYIGGCDIGLAVLVVTTAWLLIFQTGIFR